MPGKPSRSAAAAAGSNGAIAADSCEAVDLDGRRATSTRASTSLKSIKRGLVGLREAERTLVAVCHDNPKPSRPRIPDGREAGRRFLRGSAPSPPRADRRRVREQESPCTTGLNRMASGTLNRQRSLVNRTVDRRRDCVDEARLDSRRRRAPSAPVAQWIEQRFPKPRAQVRFLPGASVCSNRKQQRAGLFTREPRTPPSAQVRADPGFGSSSEELSASAASREAHGGVNAVCVDCRHRFRAGVVQDEPRQ